MGTDVASCFDLVIGLEVHCQLLTESKLFCGCSTKFGAEPNHHVCPVCLGMPGVLPVLNEKAVDFAVQLGLAMGAKINPTSVFARKQYFYPDSPKGYQITQFDLPYCEGGGIKLATGKFVELVRIHLEEDAGKNVHAKDGSLVDLNRAGTPLCEIVTHPVLESAAEAAEYLKRLRSLVRHLGVSDGNMDEGSFRCDANVSLKPKGEKKLGTRCEIKNLNSFRNIEKAIAYESERQAEILLGGGNISQETRLFDADTGRTAPMRGKEDSHDYRYFPDPDLKPLKLDSARVARLEKALPELPDAMERRFKEALGLSEKDAGILIQDQGLCAIFLGVTKANDVDPRQAANWLIGEYLAEANAKNWDLGRPPVTAAHMHELLTLIKDGTISGKIAKTVFAEMAENPGSPRQIVEKKGLLQVSDEGAIKALVEKTLDANPNQVGGYLKGNEKLLGFFVGQIMKESQGKMNPGLVNRILKERLDARKF